MIYEIYSLILNSFSPPPQKKKNWYIYGLVYKIYQLKETKKVLINVFLVNRI